MAAETARTLAPEPGLATVAGVNLAVIPAGIPVMPNVIAALKVLLAPVFKVTDAVAPFARVIALVETVSENEGGGRMVMERGTIFVWLELDTFSVAG